MTKRLTVLLVTLLLALAPVYAAHADSHTVSGLYTIEYDDGYTLDTTSYLLDITDTYTWLFMLYDSERAIDASMTLIEGYEGFSLYSASQAERDGYLNDTLDMLSDYDAEYLGIVTADAAEIPFYVFYCKNEEGAYLLAETVASGYALDFYCHYDDDNRPVDDALTQELVEVLESFAPVRR